jgi:integrase
MSRARGTGSIFKPKGSRFYWIAYYSDGKRHFEGTESEVKGDAQKLLTDRLGDIGKGVPVTPKMGKKTLGDGLQAVVDDQEMNGCRSVDHTKRRIKKHLLTHFKADDRMSAMTTAHLTAYVTSRLAKGASPASCNLELAIVARAFSLAIEGKELLFKPKVPKLTLSNVRTGFFEDDQFKAVRAALPEELRGIVTIAYFTGWRVASEILPLEWSRVDRDKKIIRLDPGTTKNSEGRTLGYGQLPELVTVIDTAWKAHEALVKAETICPYVFHRNGEQVLDLREAWKAATVAAGCPGKLLHDFRRTAVRNLVRAGVPEKTAMKVTGHKTRSVFDRYDIVNTADVANALGKLAAPAPEAKKKTSTVRAFRRRKSALRLKNGESRAPRRAGARREARNR